MMLIIFILGIVLGSLAEVLVGTITEYKSFRKEHDDPESLRKAVIVAERLCYSEPFISVYEEKAIKRLIKCARNQIDMEDDLK